ncbi:MAG: hypothetical protein HKO88_04240 [Xanthomonadales bacterium]|jgi:hypothetical protein|nr:hypothetical protein [Xanthomonadales bacterium]
MNALKSFKAALVIAAFTLPTNLLAFWAHGNGNTDGPPNGNWVGPHSGIDWSEVLRWLPFF